MRGQIPLGATRTDEPLCWLAVLNRSAGNGRSDETAATAAEAEIFGSKRKQRAERVDDEKKREAQAEPTFSNPSGGNRSLRAHGTAKGKHPELASMRTLPVIAESSNVSMHDRPGNRKTSSDVGRNPRDRPGPKGLGRNLLPEWPKPSPARDLNGRSGGRRKRRPSLLLDSAGEHGAAGRASPLPPVRNDHPTPVSPCDCCSLRLDDDLRLQRIGDEATLVRLLVERGQMLGRRRLTGECDPGP